MLTSPLVLNAFLLNHLHALVEHFRVTVCVNTEDTPVSHQLDPRVELLHLPIVRPIDLMRDLRALFWLIQLFRSQRYDAVHSVTPKAGLLAMLAGRLCGVRLRTHIFTGQVWATRRGFSRALLRRMDQLIATCATDLLADSVSQARFLEEEGVCPPERVQVFGAGSISGVDLARFSPEPGRRERVRAALGVPLQAPLFLFLGRVQRDKGIAILAEAFAQLAARHVAPHLLLVGPDEDGLSDVIRSSVPGRCHVVGLTSQPEDYIDAADVLCLPSFREGFGSVVIEAAALGRATVASRIYGLTDAVIDGQTGLLFPPGDVAALTQALEQTLDPALRERMGQQARLRAHADFGMDAVTGHWLAFYQRHLGR
ncbi:glycosyltransferase family 4 protein [Methylocystis sp. B8]|nr:glycosyltransferase family 4 protein [Methylocystis sp. B8]